MDVIRHDDDDEITIDRLMMYFFHFKLSLIPIMVRLNDRTIIMDTKAIFLYVFIGTYINNTRTPCIAQTGHAYFNNVPTCKALSLGLMSFKRRMLYLR